MVRASVNLPVGEVVRPVGRLPCADAGSSSSGGSDSRGAAHMLAGDAQLRTEFAVLDDLDADPLQVRALG